MYGSNTAAFRSRTFNSDFVKRDSEFCPTEASGEECKVPHCRYVHGKDFDVQGEYRYCRTRPIVSLLLTQQIRT